jgi:hypothetical protein
METQMLRQLHVLIEMTDEPDCRFIASWLIKTAEAQAVWSEALRDPDFEKRVIDLCAYCEPNLECAALEVISLLQQRNHVLAGAGQRLKQIRVKKTQNGLLAF